MSVPWVLRAVTVLEECVPIQRVHLLATVLQATNWPQMGKRVMVRSETNQMPTNLVDCLYDKLNIPWSLIYHITVHNH